MCDNRKAGLIAGFVHIDKYRGCSMFRELKAVSARIRYYFERHKQRWERRYKQPYPETHGEIGVIGSIRWIS